MDLIEEKDRLTAECIGCKRCTKVCPSASKGGVIPHEVMAAGTGDVSTCIMCGNCSRVCKKTDPMAVMKIIRYAANGGNFGDSYERYGFTMPPSDMAVPEPKWNGEDVTVISGCVIKCKAPFLENATASALRSMGIGCRPLKGESCCLRPPMFANIGRDEKTERRERMVREVGAGEILCLCTGCADEMSVIREKEEGTIDFLYGNIGLLPKDPHPLRLAIETGCEASDKRDMVKEIVERMGHIDIGNTMGCCGKDTKVAADLMADRETECKDADAILAVCPKCFTEYDSYKGGKPVMFIMELVAMAFGDISTLRYHNIPVE